MAQERQRGWWIPWLFAGFFGIVVAVNATMIVIASQSWTGLATGNAYEKGLAYNANLDAAAAQEDLGWSLELEAELIDRLDGRLVVELRDRDGQPLNDAAIEVQFERPTHEGADFTVTPIAIDAGRYEAGFTATLAGVWNVHIVVRRGSELFIHDSRQVLR